MDRHRPRSPFCDAGEAAIIRLLSRGTSCETMRNTLQIIFGGGLAASGIAFASGLADAIAPQLPLGLGTALVLIAAGAFLICDGVLGRSVKRKADDAHLEQSARHAIRMSAMACALALLAPALAGILNLISVAGFPMAFYFASQGSLILLALVALVTALCPSLRAHDPNAARDAQG
jgi:putative solute:sodium symporter small subunit